MKNSIIHLLLFLPLLLQAQLSDLEIINDYQEGLEKSAELDKPIFLLFDGIGCLNVQKLKKEIERNDELFSLLKEEFVLVFLRVDDRTKLPKNEVVYRNGQKVTLRTYGNKWGHLQIMKFKTNYQPYIVLMDHRERQIIESVGYLKGTDLLEHLQNGLRQIYRY